MLRWACHVALIVKTRNIYRILAETPLPGRPRRICETGCEGNGTGSGLCLTSGVDTSGVNNLSSVTTVVIMNLDILKIGLGRMFNMSAI